MKKIVVFICAVFTFLPGLIQGKSIEKGQVIDELANRYWQ